MRAMPLVAGVHVHHTEPVCSETPAGSGSPLSRVAPTFVPATVALQPEIGVAPAKASFVGAAPATCEPTSAAAAAATTARATVLTLTLKRAPSDPDAACMEKCFARP